MTWENRLVFEVSSADPDSTSPVWVDLTSRILDVIQPATLDTGRQNDLEQVGPSVVELLLNNADDALTYGNTASPYPWWGPGRKCRLRDTVGGASVPLLVGYLQVPTEGLVTAGIEQRVSITATDRLGRLASAEPFVSTLGAYILSSVRNSALKAYYPMTDPGGLTFQDITNQQPPLIRDVDSLSVQFGGGGFAPYAGASGEVAPADDVSVVAPSYNFDGTTVSGFQPRHSGWTPVALAAGKVVTVVSWMKLSLDAPAVNSVRPWMLTMVDSPSGLSNWLYANPLLGFWSGFANFGGLTGQYDTGEAPENTRSQMIAIRYGFTPSVFEFWLGRNRYVGTLGGVAPTSISITGMYAPLRAFKGLFGHLQVYVGDVVDFTYADYLAQYDMGFTGLERQTTGDRIRTILSYAGMPAVEYASTVDAGSSVMQRAQLAGQTPLDAMRDAERTEQGLLYVDPSGNLIFKDRKSLYNI